jgi:hypothetical protein
MSNNKLKMWDAHVSWDQAEEEWNRGSHAASQSFPLKGLPRLPSMPGITEETAKNLKWKSLKWMLTRDYKREVIRGFLKHPIKYGFSYLKSIFKAKSYIRKGDFFLYGLDGIEEFKATIKNSQSLFILGFSYCHKPFECPSGRFTSNCLHDAQNPVCRQCFIGKCMHALPSTNTRALLIPTVHYIGGKIFDIVHQNPTKNIIFLITACEMTLKMFGDWGNMVGIKGMGVRLDGRICNTMKAFELSEEGIKPGLTVVLPETQEKILGILRKLRD